MALWHHLQLAGDIAITTNVGKLWRKKATCVRADLQQITVKCVQYVLSICTHHASQFGVELPSKGLDQVHIVTARCFKQHLKGFDSVVCYSVHCGEGFSKNSTLFQFTAYVPFHLIKPCNKRVTNMEAMNHFLSLIWTIFSPVHEFRSGGNRRFAKIIFLSS